MAMIGVVVGEFITAEAGLGCMIMFASSAGETAGRRNRCDLELHTTERSRRAPQRLWLKNFVECELAHTLLKRLTL
jgi:hypothetical protein